MKRTEMLSIIKNQINMYHNETSIEEVTDLLIILEESGMTPPAIKVPCPTYFQNAMGQVQQGEDSVVFVNEWEAE